MPSINLAPAKWRDAVRKIEDLGFSTVSVSEHLTGGWAMDPLTAMLAAADATDGLHVLSLVLVNDFRHPVLLHRAVATMDHLTDGRVELGLGAGWMAADYDVLGQSLDAAAVRIDRLGEALKLLDHLFRGGDVSFEGRHYRVSHPASPRNAATARRPPLLVGGGGRRVLELAARMADIIGVHARLPRGRLEDATVADFAADRIDEKVRWVRDALRAAGRLSEAVELQFSIYCRVERGRRAAQRATSTFADRLLVHPALVADSPAVLVGTVEECADLLVERRERYGFSYLRLSDDVEAVAPLVHRLAGR